MIINQNVNYINFYNIKIKIKLTKIKLMKGTEEILKNLKFMNMSEVFMYC